MNSSRLGKLIAFLTLAGLLLAACRPAALEMADPPGEPVVIAAAETPAPAGPETQAAPADEGTAQPPAEGQIPEGWQALGNDRLGYSLASPPGWGVCQETAYSWAFCETVEDPAWMGFPLRLYVSAFPNDYANADWEVYNFIPTETLRAYAALPVGESMAKLPGSPRPDYMTFTRLPDRAVAGQPAAVIENSKVWGVPAGTREQVVFVITEDTTYMIGMYYETPEQLALFGQVLDSFRVRP